MKTGLGLCALGVAVAVSLAFLLQSPSAEESVVSPVATVRNRTLAAATPARPDRVRSLLSAKIVGAQPSRPVEPVDIVAFNAAVEAGETVEAAAAKAFPEGTDTDGLLAALKVMATAKDASMRRAAYRAVARLFTDADDLGAALATAKGILAALPTTETDGKAVLDLGGETEVTGDDAAETAASGDAATEADVVDDSEAEPEAASEGMVEIPVNEVDGAPYDGAQGEMLEQLLKDGIADDDASVRQEALTAASQMEDHFRYGAYEAALEGTDSALKRNVLELCSQFGRSEDVAVQQQALQDADPAVAAAAQAYLDSDAARDFITADAAAQAAETEGSDK